MYQNLVVTKMFYNFADRLSKGIFPKRLNNISYVTKRICRDYLR